MRQNRGSAGGYLMFKELRVVLSVSWCGLVLAAPVSGQPPVTQSDIDGLYDWAYSAAFGTGAYRVGQDEAFVIKVEPVVPLGLFKNRGVASRLRLPFTFGLQHFDLGDFEDIIDLSNNLQTVTFVPGLDFNIPMRGSWELRPFVHLGYGHQFSGSESAWITYFGVNSHLQLPSLGEMEIKMINGLQWFGQKPNHGPSEMFARLLIGFEGDMQLGSWKIDGRQLYLKPHIAWYYYFNPPGFGQILEPAITLKQEYEIALAVGLAERISFKVFSFDRVGIALKGGPDIVGVRIYFSSVFQ